MDSTLIQFLNSPYTQDQKEIFFINTQKPLIKNSDYNNLYLNITNLKTHWPEITTSRIIKIIRKLFSLIPCDDNLNKVIPFLNNLISYATTTNRHLLRLDLECKRIFVFIFINKFHEALNNIQITLKDLKKFDDKTNLILLYVYESKAWYKLKNYSKAKSSLTSARSLAVSCYCSYELQAQIDLFNGMYLCDSRNYLTACSYFVEAVEGFRIDCNDELCRVAYRYLLLANILKDSCEGSLKGVSNKTGSSMNSGSSINKTSNTNKTNSNKTNSNKTNGNTNNENTTNTTINENTPNNITTLLTKYPYENDTIVKILININTSIKQRSLNDYLKTLSSNKTIITSDDFLNSHLQYLYDILLEANILKIIEAYSVIYLNHIAKDLRFDIDTVEIKIRKMILDGKINGIIDHSDMSLNIFNNESCDKECVSKELMNKIDKIVSN